MITPWPRARLREVLRRVERFEPRDELTEYPFAGTYSFARGIFVGERKLGSTFALPKIQRIRAEASASVNEIGRAHSRFIQADTLMLTNSGATLGVPKITKIAGCFNDGSQAFLNLDSCVEKEFLYYLFKSKTFWFREQLARGQGQPNLNTDMTKQMDVPVPTLSEQRRIVSELDA